MPSVKIPKHSTDTDMTPFVDVAFLILSFFMLATKFKPPEPVPIETPGSVLSKQLPENDAVLVSIDSADRVFFTILDQKKGSTIKDQFIQNLNSLRNLNLTKEQMANFKNSYMTGIPFEGLASYLGTNKDQLGSVKQPGIPVTDTLNNQLIWWINAAKNVFASNGIRPKYLIKGDGDSKYPSFEGVISAFKKNEEFKYNLVTALEGIPPGSDLEKANNKLNKQ